VTSTDRDATLRVSQIVRELSALRDKGASGTYSVRAEDGEQVRISIDLGEVGAVRFRGRTYPPARVLEVISGLRAVATSFSDAADRAEPQRLAGLQHDGDAADDAARRLIREHLVDFLGPIAVHICDESRLPRQSFEDLLVRVSREIDNPERAKAFCSDIRRKYYGPAIVAMGNGGTHPSMRSAPMAVGDADSARMVNRASANPRHVPGNSAAGAKDMRMVDREALRLISKRLVDILGPIAEIVCSEKCAPNQSIESLLGLISKEIDDPQRARTFREAVRRDLAMGKEG
jgi:hypothetical protein